MLYMSDWKHDNDDENNVFKLLKNDRDAEQKPCKSVMFNSVLHHNPAAILELTFES